MDDEIYYDAVDMLKELIATPSTSHDEAKAVDVVERWMRKAGFEPQRKGNNTWCIAKEIDTGKPTLLLNSHIDTVKPNDEWKHNPFEAEIDEATETLYGLGSNDAGASVVSLFAAFRDLTKRPQQYNVIFLASCEEEVGGKGGIESVLPLLPAISVAIVGEPTSMQPATAEKGLMVLDGVIHGVAGHAAREGGVNAIYKALPLIEKLRNLKFDKESALLGPVKVTVTQIAAGSQHNVIPDVCKIVVDVRTTDAYSNAETLEMIQNVITDDSTLTPRSTRLNSSNISPDHPLVQRLTILGKKPFGSPTLSDQSLMPFPSLKMGPGDSSRSHTADEYITLPEIRDAIQTYITLLDGAAF